MLNVVQAVDRRGVRTPIGAGGHSARTNKIKTLAGVRRACRGAQFDKHSQNDHGVDRRRDPTPKHTEPIEQCSGSLTYGLKGALKASDQATPELAVADGALGFWKALPEVWPKTREQRCWVHKTANVLNRLPKSLQGKAKRAFQNIWMAETKQDAEAAFDIFAEICGTKYDKAVECLTKDRDVLLAFYDFPAEHWKTNPIESTFDGLNRDSLTIPGCNFCRPSS